MRREVLGETYNFKELESMLGDRMILNPAFYRIKSEDGLIGLMSVFSENFSSAYQSGDGVIFYEDGEQHSADPYDKFDLLSVIPIKEL